jgi:hypothetical protein
MTISAASCKPAQCPQKHRPENPGGKAARGRERREKHRPQNRRRQDALRAERFAPWAQPPRIGRSEQRRCHPRARAGDCGRRSAPPRRRADVRRRAHRHPARARRATAAACGDFCEFCPLQGSRAAPWRHGLLRTARPAAREARHCPPRAGDLRKRTEATLRKRTEPNPLAVRPLHRASRGPPPPRCGGG